MNNNDDDKANQTTTTRTTTTPQSAMASISLEELSRRIHCAYTIPKPTEEDQVECSESTLSFTPWILQYDDTNDHGDKMKKDSSIKNQNSFTSFFPPWSYLDLRRQQNCAWATDRLTEGDAILLEDPRKAERFYKQGLELVPDHVDLLIAYGKLLLQTKHQPLAMAKFQRALQVDPTNTIAKEYWERLQRQSSFMRQEMRKPPPPIMRESSAFQDVLLERTLAQDTLAQDDDGNDQSNHDDNEHIEGKRPSHEKKNHYREDGEESHKHNRKPKKRHHKKRKRSRSNSPTPSSSSSYVSSEDLHHNNRKRKRKHASPSDSASHDDSLRNEEEDDEQRRKRRKHRHHRSKRKHKKRKRKKEDSSV